MSRGRRPSRASRRSASRKLKPQSTRTRVAPQAPADARISTIALLPLLPLPSDAKRSNLLLQLLVEEREDALRGLRVLRGAVLVEDVDQARVLLLLHLDPVLLRLHLGVLRGEVEELAQQA